MTVLSGEQIEIASGAARAVVTTVGATLRTYDIGGRAVIDGFDADEVCPGGRGQVLMPWPNRIAGARYDFEGRKERLPIDEPELGHAIHGLVRWSEWRVDRRGPDFARFGHVLRARPGFPFPLDLVVEYRLSPAGLTVMFTARNAGAVACPFGAGAHPYFLFPGAPVDEIELRVRAAERLEVDDRSIPRARIAVEPGPFDFRQAKRIGASRLDHALTHLERDGGGVAEVLLRHGREEIRVWQDRSFDFVQVYTGDTLPDAARRRRSIAVEPMTCAPNAFNSGDGLRVLAPNETFEGRWGVKTSRS